MYLTVSAERIAEGHYDETIPDTNRDDEVGIFQQHFQTMQQALNAEVSKQEELKSTLQARHDELQKTYQQIQDDNNVKAVFLHNVTDKMIAPSESILASVNNLCDNYQDITLETVNQEIDNIKQQGITIQEVLNSKFQARKEDSHE